MAKTLLIVEDDSDKYTFEAILRHINLNNTIAVTTTPVIEWKSIADENNSLKPNGLIKGLKALLNDISNEKYDKIGIIRDMDTNSKEDRLLLVNTALKAAYPKEAQNIDDVNKLVPFSFQQNGTEETLTIQFACYFVHVINEKGIAKGEIEDILKAIKKEPSPIADCVDKQLPSCLEINGEDELREKDLVKLWFNNYQRYDTLPKEQRTNPFTTIKYIMEHRTAIFDFGKDIKELDDLKAFLKMMQ
jgi:hypothetical protein